MFGSGKFKRRLFATLAALFLMGCSRNVPDFGYMPKDGIAGEELALNSENNNNNGGQGSAGDTGGGTGGDTGGGTGTGGTGAGGGTGTGGSGGGTGGSGTGDVDHDDDNSDDDSYDDSSDDDSDHHNDYTSADGVFINVARVVIDVQTSDNHSCHGNNFLDLPIEMGALGRVDLLQLRNDVALYLKLKKIDPHTARIKLYFTRNGSEVVKNEKRVCEIIGTGNGSNGYLYTLKFEHLKAEDFNRVIPFRFDFNPYEPRDLHKNGDLCRLRPNAKVL